MYLGNYRMVYTPMHHKNKQTTAFSMYTHTVTISSYFKQTEIKSALQIWDITLVETRILYWISVFFRHSIYLNSVVKKKHEIDKSSTLDRYSRCCSRYFKHFLHTGIKRILNHLQPSNANDHMNAIFTLSVLYWTITAYNIEFLITNIIP